MDMQTKWGPLPVWAWGTIAALTGAVWLMRRNAAAAQSNAAAPSSTGPGVTQIQPVIIGAPQGPPSKPSDATGDTAPKFYGGM
jgi:hypothetical protein